MWHCSVLMRLTLRKSPSSSVLETISLTWSAKVNTDNQPISLHRAHLTPARCRSRPGSPISNQEFKKKSAGNTGNIMLGADFLPPSYIRLWGRGWVAFLFSAGTPRWVRHRFQSIQMCSVTHKAFLCRSGVRTSLTFWPQCEMFFWFVFKGERQQRFRLIGRSTPQGVKWVQAWNILTRELCWLLVRCITYRSQISFYNQPYEDKWRMDSNLAQFGNSKF